jgi:predicted phosphate transport protein (TIGR00153 family)
VFLFSRLMPREGKFFDLFQRHAEQMKLCASELKLLIDDLSKIEQRSRAIKYHESAADKITHETMHLLHNTFITPLDREDIHQLINKMDDVLDLMEDASQCIALYDIKALPPEAKQLAAICVACADHLHNAMGMLSNMKNSADLLKICVEIDRLESDADAVLRAVVVRLFRDEPDTRELIKIKAVFDILETVTDRCEDVANVIEGIVIEYS